MQSDDSCDGVGATLLQEYDDDIFPIAFCNQNIFEKGKELFCNRKGVPSNHIRSKKF